MDRKAIGKEIRHIRENASLTQEKLAEKCHLSPFYISQIERGIKTPSLETFIIIANALHTSADSILYEVLDNIQQSKAPVLSEKLDKMPLQEQQQILQILDALLNKR